MFKKKGIALKTFVYTSVLIVFVVFISFGILYLVMPKYYLYTKNNTMQKNADILVKNINQTTDSEQLITLIDDFSTQNNAQVWTMNNDREVVIEYSSNFTDLAITTSNPIESEGETGIIDVNMGLRVSLPLTDVIFIQSKSSSIQTATAISQTGSLISIEKEVDSELFNIISMTSTLQPIGEANAVIFSLMPYLLIIDIIIALVAAFFFTKQITTPIIKLSETAVAMQALTPDIVSNIHTNDEFGTLSKNLDLLYSNLCSNIGSLQAEVEKVSVLEKSKTDFMRAASHELKTPIAGLNGIVEGMIDGIGKFKDRDKYLIECKNLIDKMTGLVGEILFSSKLEACVDINIKSVSIFDIVENSIGEHNIFIEEKHLKVKVGDINLNIQTDESILNNTISNIISNAIRYTNNNGEINIAIINDGEYFVLSIENECDSIPEEELLKLFEPFYTRNYSRNKDFSGTGLGLFIVKNNLNRLGLDYDIKNTDLGIQFNIYFKTV